MARGLGGQQVWVVEHLRRLPPDDLPTCRQIAEARYGTGVSKGDAEKIRQVLHRLHHDGLLSVERRGRDLQVTWVERQLDVRAPNALRRQADGAATSIEALAARLRAERNRRR